MDENLLVHSPNDKLIKYPVEKYGKLAALKLKLQNYFTSVSGSCLAEDLKSTLGKVSNSVLLSKASAIYGQAFSICGHVLQNAVSDCQLGREMIACKARYVLWILEGLRHLGYKVSQ